MITDDPTNPNLKAIDPETGLQRAYLVLSAEERAKGFVRLYRDAYIHIGCKPKYPLRDMSPEEQARHASEHYKPVKYEEYPESELPMVGKYWTQEALDGGCHTLTVMGRALAETWSRDPKFYGGTYCSGCCRHFPVAEFCWEDGQILGS